MEILNATNLTVWTLLLPLVLVLLGAGFQVASGVGLGLIAGPGLLFVLSGPAAIQTAILLNLALTILLLPSELKDINWPVLARISIWSAFGVLAGSLLIMVLDTGVLKLVCGIVVILSVVQLRFAGSSAGSANGGARLGVGGVASGIMTGAFAVPGPVALWALLNENLPPKIIRATLRAYFLFAYSLALLLHFWLLGTASEVWPMALLLLPGVLIGILLGIVARRSLDGERLRRVLSIVLLLMGGSLLIKGILDVI